MKDLKGENNSRSIYIDNIPVDDALLMYKKQLSHHLKSEKINVGEGLFRITKEAVFANISSPHYHGSAMDGICVRAKDTYGASENNPKVLCEGEDFDYINTGNPMPEDKDAVIMIEDVDQLGDGKIRLIAPTYPWQHIRQVGEDIVQGEMIIPSNHRIRPMDMGALISGGVKEINVYPKMRIGILPTGTEITQNVKELKRGRIIDSNSKVFEGLVIEAGGMPIIYEPSKDDLNALKEAIKKGIGENDLLIINAGSSAGSKDFTVDIIRELGSVIVHGVALKPGKPTILGVVHGKGAIGIPGYPVSAYFSFETFVKPIVEWFSGMKSQEKKVEAILSQRVVSSLKHEELVRVTLGEVSNRCIATPLSRGAGNTMSLVRADGVLKVPRMSEGIEGGQSVRISLIKPYEEILRRVVLIGSHDILLDLIADKMPLTSGHVGSLGGIMAMKRSECHIAPMHLLDEETGKYNDAYVKKYFPKGTMAIIKGVKRLQGFMVQKGNPNKIKGFEDLIRDDVQYVNRQRGAGTRQLFDYELKNRNINFEAISGYNREMTTHMTVAVAVQSGAADVGLGVYSAAKAMGLDFIPVGFEEYEFLVPSRLLKDNRIQEFISVLQSKTLKEQIKALGGYELDNPGEIRIVGEQDD